MATTTEKIKEIAYDYENQAWVINGKYTACAHPDKMNCHCFGRLHAGEKAEGNRIY